MSEKEKAVPQLGPNELYLFEAVSLTYDAVIAQGVSPEQIMAPEFWAHHGVKLRPWNEIRARAEDGTWMAKLLVTDCSRTWARVHMLELHKLTTSDVSLSQASEAEVQKRIALHLVKHSQGRMWHVVRKSDGAVIQENIAEKDTAIAWLAKYARENAPAAVPAPEPAVAA